MTIVILDGPVGTELARRGVPTPMPLWTAAAIETAPDVLRAIHADYAAAGATVHTANTFRTDPWTLRADPDPDRWRRLTDAAVDAARSVGGRTAGSIAPLEDCYTPAASPPPSVAAEAHGRMAVQLRDAGVDLLLCETFPHPGEALIALDAALATGLPTWLSLTVGPTGDLMDDSVLVQTLREGVRRGAEAVLVNCARPDRLTELLPSLAALGVSFGAYGNVGVPDPEVGWRSDGDAAPGPYAESVDAWVAIGATIIGGCCGTTPDHVREVAARFG